MKYPNDTHRAVLELERQRLGNYGNENEFSGECENGCSSDAEIYSANGATLCRDCLCRILRERLCELLADLSPDEEYCTDKILSDMLDDFSDAEIETYANAYFRRV